MLLLCCTSSAKWTIFVIEKKQAQLLHPFIPHSTLNIVHWLVPGIEDIAVHDLLTSEPEAAAWESLTDAIPASAMSLILFRHSVAPGRHATLAKPQSVTEIVGF